LPLWLDLLYLTSWSETIKDVVNKKVFPPNCDLHRRLSTLSTNPLRILPFLPRLICRKSQLLLFVTCWLLLAITIIMYHLVVRRCLRINSKPKPKLINGGRPSQLLILSVAGCPLWRQGNRIAANRVAACSLLKGPESNTVVKPTNISKYHKYLNIIGWIGS